MDRLQRKIDTGVVGLVSLSLLSTIGWLCSSALPWEIALIAGMEGQTINSASYIATAELLSFAIAVLVSGRICRRSDLRSTIGIAGVAAVGASLLGILGDNLVWLIISRLAFGASTGIIAACINALAGRLPSPEKIFAYFLIALCPVLALLMIGVPWLDEIGFSKSLFFVEACIVGLAMLITRFVPVLPWRDDKPAYTGAFIPKGSLLLLLGLAILYIAQAVVWSFAEEAGKRLGVTGTYLGMLFMISAFMMGLGAAIVAFVTRRAGYILPSVACYAGFVLVSGFCYIFPSSLLFALGVISFNAIAAVLLPIIQAVLATRDPEGRAAALSIGAINFGAAFGPLVGSFGQVGGDIKPIGYIAILFFVMSAACVLGSLAPVRSRPASSELA